MMSFTISSALSALLLTSSAVVPSTAFTTNYNTHSIQRSTTTTTTTTSTKLMLIKQENDEESSFDNSNNNSISRRAAILQTVSTAASVATIATAQPSDANALDLPNPFAAPDTKSNGGVYKQAKRATAYLVDSTIPPTLVPFRASREAAILKGLGSGSGTQKTAFIEDSLTLNNMMNKGVFGAIDLVKSVVPQSGDENQDGSADSDKKKNKSYDATFVCLGLDYNDATGEDANLAVGVMTDIIKPRRGLNTALALEYVPISLQSALDAYSSGGSEGSEQTLIDTLVNDGQVEQSIITSQLPILRFARSKQMNLIASRPDKIDIQTVRKDGLQSIDPDRRANYVVDPEGFINWTQDPRSRLYTEKSLLKDWIPTDEKDAPGNYFAEKILIHEAIATSVSKYAIGKRKAGVKNSLILTVAPISDLRFFGGPNGRIPRVCKSLKSDTNIDDEAVTTILLNPSAEETLSKSRFIRLEIGTAPKNLAYQTKVADYLWFSTMPKVNMLPRLMNG